MAESTIEVIEAKRNWHWRNTMRPARFFNVDARAGIFWFILVFRLASPFFWILAILMTLVFVALEHKGLTFPAALRTFRSWFIGPKRPGFYSIHYRKMRDFG